MIFKAIGDISSVFGLLIKKKSPARREQGNQKKRPKKQENFESCGALRRGGAGRNCLGKVRKPSIAQL